jgi:hypothetical protein
MTTISEIPLAVGTPQTFGIVMGGTSYQLTLTYKNTDQGGWVLDIDDNAGNQIVHGIPLVTGVDLLKQYKHLGFTGGIWVQTSSDPDAVPTFANLGDDGSIYWVSP